MPDVRLAEKWAVEILVHDALTVWNAIRRAVAGARDDEVPGLVSTVNWLVEVECHLAPPVQQQLVGWLAEEASGADFDAPRTPRPTPTEADTARAAAKVRERELTAELDRLTKERDALQTRLSSLRAGVAGSNA